MSRRYSVVLLFVVLLCSNRLAAQVSVSSNPAAQVMAQMLAGQGVTVTNPTLNCPTDAYGIFSAGVSNLGLDSGIILTTGRAETQSTYYGVNGFAGNFASTNNGSPGDVQLNTLAGQNTHDACALEFDVTPGGDTLSFSYVFGSEEYTNATCGQYNDAFAFFISGPGITGMQNIALVPGTTIPVTINSINSGIPGAGNSIAACNAMGPGSPFTSYYVDNGNGTTITYRGMTTVLQAIRSVTPCNTYHLKIVIADAGNATYDSGVFLKAGSLQTTSFKARAVGVGVNTSGTPYIVKGCNNGTIRIRRSQLKSTPQTVKYTIGGTAANGVDYSTIADSAIIPANDTVALVTIHGLPTALNGSKTVLLRIKSPYICGSSQYADSATLLLYDTLYAKILTHDTAICQGDQFTIKVTGSDNLGYAWTPASALGNSQVKEPLANLVSNTLYTMTATWPGTGCAPIIRNLSVKVNPLPQVIADGPAEICLHTALQLTATPTPVYSGYSYQWTGPNGYSSTAQNPLIADVVKANEGNYSVTIKVDSSQCTARASVTVHVNAPDAPVVNSPQVFCEHKPAPPVTAAGNNLFWYTTASGGSGNTEAPVVSTQTTGAYQFYVSQTVNGCESERAQVEVDVKHCCDGIIFIPDVFTPNGDGKNDVFRLSMGYGYHVEQLRIFNRWGQLIFQEFSNESWDGTFNGVQVELGDYFYQAEISCIDGARIFRKGEIMLVR